MMEEPRSDLLSIIIPVHNEENTVLQVIKKLKEVNFPLNYEIIVIDDGSTDNTREKVKTMKGITLFENQERQGKGYAMRRGIELCKGNITVFQDADLEYYPDDIPKLLEPIITGVSEVVYGSRFTTKSYKINYIYRFGNLFLTKLTNLLFGSNLTDMETGYKIMRKEVLNDLDLTSNGFDIEAEITAKLLKRKHNILEMPIKYKGRSKSEGKKIKVRDGIKTAFYLFSLRFF